MQPIPTLYTPRLILRPFTLADAPRVKELAGDQRIAATTALIPHPYPEGAAETWIKTHEAQGWEAINFNFAITLAGTRTPGRELDATDTGHLVGAINIAANGDDSANDAVLGYWIGVHYWNKGFATEAANAVLHFGFTRRRYDRVSACHLANNSASGRVLQKLGMIRQPGTRASETRGRPVELIDYEISREAWSRGRIIYRWKQPNVIPESQKTPHETTGQLLASD